MEFIKAIRSEDTDEAQVIHFCDHVVWFWHDMVNALFGLNMLAGCDRFGCNRRNSWIEKLVLNQKTEKATLLCK